MSAHEHLCTIEPPGRFKPGSLRQIFKAIGSRTVATILGRRPGEDILSAQSHRYPTATWTEEAARKHCQQEAGRFRKAAGSSQTVEALEGRWPPGLLAKIAAARKRLQNRDQADRLAETFDEEAARDQAGSEAFRLGLINPPPAGETYRRPKRLPALVDEEPLPGKPITDLSAEIEDLSWMVEP